MDVTVTDLYSPGNDTSRALLEDLFDIHDQRHSPRSPQDVVRAQAPTHIVTHSTPVTYGVFGPPKAQTEIPAALSSGEREQQSAKYSRLPPSSPREPATDS
ncbi:hypothetical protein FS749_011713 [Ceratobasidium sp. UAMH 11750]|nr:hypothetical protein FS749_011713 [Ceratobasidium sp. UAMH 11750]